jgi:hypothetical protein
MSKRDSVEVSLNVRSLFLVWTTEATRDHLDYDKSRYFILDPALKSYLVPYLSIPFTSFSSSSGAQPPLTTSEAILANHRLRQSLFVLLGTCFAMACHLLGFELSGSSEKDDEMPWACEVRRTMPTSLDSITEELVFFSSPGTALSAKHD